jgi:hypothetical protein
MNIKLKLLDIVYALKKDLQEVSSETDILEKIKYCSGLERPTGSRRNPGSGTG